MGDWRRTRESPEREERRRLIFSLIQEGRTMAQVAAELGISRGRVHQLLHYNLPPDTRPPDRRRNCPVRLIDIPESVRINAAYNICMEVEQRERSGIFAAAVYPSDTIYWINVAA